MELMEGVEEIPGVVLAGTIDLDLGDSRSSLDALERRPRAIDIAAQLAHHPLRVYYGRPRHSLEAATPEDISEAAPAIERCVPARSGHHSRTDFHKDAGRRRWCVALRGSEELLGIGSALGAVGAGAFGMNSDFDDEAAELAWMTQLARETGRPVWFL